MFLCPWGTFPYRLLPFGLCNAPTTFQRDVIGIFFDLIHDCVEIYIDDFTTYCNEFDEALEKLEKTLIRCKESNISLNNDKCTMMLTDGIVLGHHILAKGIQVNLTKFKVILNFLTLCLQKELWSFLGYTRYYRRFIDILSHIARSLFSLLNKNYDFLWKKS
jgi:hypothetical protein